MLQYLLETLAFQLTFLLVYDLFLKKETFFQWNRVYLMGTFALSLILPWIKIEALKTTVTQEGIFYSEFLWYLNPIEVTQTTKTSFWELFAGYQWLFLAGTFFMLLWFAIKLYRIQQLRSNGIKQYYPDFTKIIVDKSEVAFSFFKNVFIGDGIPKEKEPQIVAHELVHIKQWHSLDLLLFELLRVGLWFNPLVYVYQKRISELHEFIADNAVAKTNKRAQYQLLLEEAFQTQNISFVNQFFKQSLIKKRIVMLTKEKSKTVSQLKYLAMLPVVLAMLVYSSCETEAEQSSLFSSNVKIEDNLIIFKVYDLNNLSETERDEQSKVFSLIESNENTGKLRIVDTFKNSMEIEYTNGVIDNVHVNKEGGEEVIPFATINEVPIFPGCENAADKKVCFMEKMQEHIRKHFNYPEEAQNLGIEGRVSVMFTIDSNGGITNIKKRGPHELLENEVERIIKRLPRMQPGIHNGEPVKVPFSIPINFKLE